MRYEFHPLANIFPLLEGDELTALADDIKANGQHEPILLAYPSEPKDYKCYSGKDGFLGSDAKCNLKPDDGRWLCTTCDYGVAPCEPLILDGRNRYRACLQAGVEPWFEDVGLPEARWPSYVVSLNLRRRHLNESQRSLVAAKLANLKDGQTKTGASIDAPVSQIDAAELLNVSRPSVQRAAAIIEKGETTLVEAVQDGKVSVFAAADVATLPKEEQREIVAKGEREILEAAKKIRAEKAEKKREERIEKLAEISKGNAELTTDRKFPVIYADPPWRYENPPMGATNRAIENHYPTMSLEEICALPVRDLATDDAILYMWATSPKLAECMKVVEAWGFDYRTNFVWVKDKIGMGYHARNQHEILIVAKRGNIPPPAVADRVSSVVYGERTAHSAKPVEFYELIEQFYPSLPKIELFCRSPRDGWAVWGNQSEVAA